MKKPLHNRYRRGFTMVEIVVVIAVLGILAGIGIPAMGGFIREGNRQANEAKAAVLTEVARTIRATGRGTNPHGFPEWPPGFKEMRMGIHVNHLLSEHLEAAGPFEFAYNGTTGIVTVVPEGTTPGAGSVGGPYTVTFMNGADIHNQQTNVGHGGAASAPDVPVREGHTFTGWDKTYNNIVADTIVNALFTINQYTITFDTDGGSGVAAITQDFGTAVTAPSPPTKLYHTFTGWDPALPTTIPANNITLTAQWGANEYTITFDSVGGSAVAPITQAYNTPVTAPDNPTKSHNTFSGWAPAVPATMPGDNLTVFAQWNQVLYTINFNSAGGTAVAPIVAPFDTAITAPANPTRTGYNFVGWTPALPATMPDTNPTLTAQWSALPAVTISFNSNGGSTVAPISGAPGTTVTPPANPTRTGYTFGGWSPALPGTFPSANMTVTAQWTIIPLVFETVSLPAGATGVAYSAQLQASGGTGTYTWTRTAGSLPVGLSLSSSGVISGTPTTAGTYNFTVQVSDGIQTASRGLSITVAAPLSYVSLNSHSRTSFSLTFSHNIQSILQFPAGSGWSASGTDTSTVRFTRSSNPSEGTYTVRVQDLYGRTLTVVVDLSSSWWGLVWTWSYVSSSAP